MDKRPKLNKNISSKDFSDFYWLKEELIDFCRDIGINTSASKIELSRRILKFLNTGEIIKKRENKILKLPKATAPITKNTILGVDKRSYKEKKNFLQLAIGKRFHFTVYLLEYFKKNTGKRTYGDLIKQWYKEQAKRENLHFKTKIAPQFEYNAYIRGFLKDNSDKTKKEAIKYWKIKKSLRGDNTYKITDLNL